MYATTLPRSNWLRRASIRLAWYRHMPASSYYLNFNTGSRDPNDAHCGGGVFFMCGLVLANVYQRINFEACFVSTIVKVFSIKISWPWHLIPFDSLGTTSYCHSIENMAISFQSVILVENRDFFHSSTPPLRGPRRHIDITFGTAIVF